MQQHDIVGLSPEERQELSRSLKCGQGLARRQTNLCHALTVLRKRRRFVDHGLGAALCDKERPGAQPKITGEVEAHLVHLACSAAPEGHSAWTLRLLADKLVELKLVESISPTQVGVRLKKTGSSCGKSSRGVCLNRAPIS